MFLLKLIRVLAFILFFWLFWHLLYSLGRKKVSSHQGTKNTSNHTHRKFVESSVIEENNKADDEKHT